MPTQVDHTWLPLYTEGTSYDMLGVSIGTRDVPKEVQEILSHILYRGYRGTESVPKMKKLRDSHSSLTSDDRIWYMRGMPPEEIGVLKTIKIKGDALTIPRTLSAKIQLAIDGLIS